ncbi:MAG TPA: FAD-binding oxidoreductase [Chloroflexota bacterium]|nr:FAD-binding oxidoreductase [Chloroflexota bacterium]
MRRARFTSFDGGVVEYAHEIRPDRYRVLESALDKHPRIARGGGYSYAAASFGAGSVVLQMGAFNRVLRFDRHKALIEVEAGITLGDLLHITLPAGLSLPALPGFPAITVGGCIAADVHGKNPARDGTFCGSVADLTLYHPRHGPMRIGRDTEASLFDLTCGGYGLTGVIQAATLRLEPVPGQTVKIHRTSFGTLEDAIELLRDAQGATMAYTWHDAVPARATFGRGFLYRGAICPGSGSATNSGLKSDSLTAATRGAVPVSLLTRITGQALTSAFWRLESSRPSQSELPLFEALFPFARRSAYFRLYGRRGLAESQILVPNREIGGFLSDLRRELFKRQPPSLMMSLKRFEGNQRLLTFDGEGVCVTIDFMRTSGALEFLAVLDRMAMAVGGIPNIIKDSRLPQHVVRACYPEYAHFCHRLLDYDPDRVFRSELSQRLGL